VGRSREGGRDGDGAGASQASFVRHEKPLLWEEDFARFVPAGLDGQQRPSGEQRRRAGLPSHEGKAGARANKRRRPRSKS
jgi:hypothetical protein